MISVLLLDIITYFLVNNDINTSTAVKLIHVILACTSVIEVLFILYVKNSCHTCLLQSVNFLFVNWVWSNQNIHFINLVEKEVVDEVSISFVNPAIDNPDLIGVQPEVRLSRAKLTFIFLWILNVQLPSWTSLNNCSFLILFDKMIVVFLKSRIVKLTTIWVLNIWDFHRALVWLHILAIFHIHPFEFSRELVHPDLAWFVGFEYKIFTKFINRMRQSISHLEGLPLIIVMNKFYSSTAFLHLELFLNRIKVIATTSLVAFLSSIRHDLEVGNFINTIFPRNALSSFLF